MNTNELKAAIEAKVIKIKEVKSELRKDHRDVPNSSSLMYELWGHKAQIRAMYLVYGWFRGKPYSVIEQNSEVHYGILYYVKKLLDNDDHYKLFLNWLESTA